MDACLKLLFAISLFNLFGYSYGYFQWSVQHETIMCLGGDVNLIWDYTTNETTSIVLWEKLGSPNILVARIFGGAFNAIGPYNGRVTQTNLGNAAILMSSVTANDSGTYGCTIQSAHSENITLLVAETPSGLPYFNKTGTSLTCNPPQNLGSPPVETKLKFQNGTTKSSLTTTGSGTYQCCIIGDAVRCLSSTSNTETEVCVTETLVSLVFDRISKSR